MLLIPITLVISACSTPTPEPVIEVRSKPIERPVLSLPSSTSYQTRPVEWVIITPENFNEKIETLKNNKEETAFFALSPTGYENLSKNMADILRFVREQNSVIVAYKNYYENANRTITNHNLSQ